MRNAVSTSAAMKAATKDSVADLTASLASIGLAALDFGAEGAAVGAATVGLALPFKWAYKVLFRPSPSGSKAVLAQLVRRP